MTTTHDRMRSAAIADRNRPGPDRSWPAITAEVADEMVAEAADLLAVLGAAMLRDSAAWFAESHARGHHAVQLHFALGIGGEAGEVLDVIKKADICGLVSECAMHAPGKHDRAALAAELVDVLTYALALAAHEDIDLAAAYRAKRAENVARWGDPAELGQADGCAR